MASRTPPPNQIAVVTVHGTGDTATGPDGDKWFQNGSAFADRLKQRLAKQGVEAAIVPHLWTGANSAQGRENGARSLARAIRKHAKDYGGVHVIAHSHGGNVADTAASMLGWRLGKNRPQKVSSITTVGTPFFKSRLGAAESFGGIAFLIITLFSILALLAVALVVTFMLPTMHGVPERYAQDFMTMAAAEGRTATAAEADTYARSQMEDVDLYKGLLTALAAILPVSAVALFFIIPLAVTGLLRILRLMRKQNAGAALFSVWHPNDEAISFLQRIEELPIEPFPRWALWRSSRTTGVIWGVRAVIVTLLLAIGVSAAGMAKIEITDDHYTAFGERFGFDGLEYFGGMTTGDLGLFLFFATIIGAPLLFGTAYLLTRLLRGLAFELVGRGWLNTTISSVLRGMAFGRDGDERIGNVATQSHIYGVRPYIVEGEVADRMRAGAANSASSLIEKYRWSLFSVGPDTNGAVNKLATDAMTWNSLIHTTYFDQPEIADVIGDYIAESVERDREALAGKK